MFQRGDDVDGDVVEVEDDGEGGGLVHGHEVPLKVPDNLCGESPLGPVHADGEEYYTRQIFNNSLLDVQWLSFA